MKYCPECGKKTFAETGENDDEHGDEFVCLSCGAVWFVNIEQPRRVYAEPDCREPYNPITGDIEYMLDRYFASYTQQFLSLMKPLPAFFNTGKVGDTIVFRKHNPVEGKDQ